MVLTPGELPQLETDQGIALTRSARELQARTRERFMHIKLEGSTPVLVICGNCESQFDPNVKIIAARQGITGKEVEDLIENASHSICDPCRTELYGDYGRQQ